MEFIAPAHMSHPGTLDTQVQNSLSNPNSIFSLFPPAKSLCSSDGSLSNRSLIPDLYDYPSISSFFPPNSSRSSSLSSADETQHLSPYYIPSFFPPIHSQVNSISSETPPYGFAYSIPSIFQPNHSFSSSIESTHDHDMFITELFHEPHKTRWLPLSFNIDRIIAVPQEVEEEFEQARRERWTYAMLWKEDWPGSRYGHNTISAVKRFYNGDYYMRKTNWFLFTRLWPGSVIHHLFDPRKKWSPEDYEAAMSERAPQGHKAGLKSMSWVPMADGVMEFGSTQLIDRHVTNKWFVNLDRKNTRLSIPPDHWSRNLDTNEVS